MTLTLPDTIENFRLTPGEVRLELAGVDFFAFQRALGERGIPTVTAQMLEDDLASLKTLFPS